jgi:uncharacterized protein YecT (DUF1311 family)
MPVTLQAAACRTVMVAGAFAAVLTLLVCRPAAAINCNAASTRPEKAICADPAAKAADEQMAAAFAALRASMSDKDRDALMTDQRQWIKTRDDSCSYAGSNGRPPAELPVCLRKQSDERRLFLSGMPADGPGLSGPGVQDPIRPFFVKGKDGRTISGLRFAVPRSNGERALNRAVDDLLKTVNVSDGSEGDKTDEFSMALTYASPSLVSAEVIITYPNSAHPLPMYEEINVNLAAGRMLTFDDVFRREALASLTSQCRSQFDDFVGEAARSDLSDNEMRDEILKDREDLVQRSFSDMTRWNVGSRKMTLIVEDRGRSRLMSSCNVDTARLKPLMRPGFNLP